MKCPVCGEHGCPCYRTGFDDGLDADDLDEEEDEELEEESDLERDRR